VLVRRTPALEEVELECSKAADFTPEISFLAHLLSRKPDGGLRLPLLRALSVDSDTRQMPPALLALLSCSTARLQLYAGLRADGSGLSFMAGVTQLTSLRLAPSIRPAALSAALAPLSSVTQLCCALQDVSSSTAFNGELQLPPQLRELQLLNTVHPSFVQGMTGLRKLSVSGVSWADDERSQPRSWSVPPLLKVRWNRRACACISPAQPVTLRHPYKQVLQVTYDACADVIAELQNPHGCQLIVDRVVLPQRWTESRALTAAGEAALVRALQQLARGGVRSEVSRQRGFNFAAVTRSYERICLLPVGGEAGTGPGKPNHAAWLAALAELCAATGVPWLGLRGITLSVQDLDSFARLFPGLPVRSG
jgi:hypothetical protein